MAAGPASARGTPIPAAAAGESQRYVGLATRVVAITIDAALVSFVAIIVGLGAGLILALLHLPRRFDALVAVIGGAASILWTIGYFVAFWSGTGQTPGARIMQIRVITTSGGRLKPRRALLRCLGVVLAALPLFAGFVPILYDRRRRGFQDRFAGTLVVDAPQVSLAQTRLASRWDRSTDSRHLPPPRSG
jgi:uncharacterized RDD family membrane protein YckC